MYEEFTFVSDNSVASIGLIFLATFGLGTENTPYSDA
jgi:hypothetical protein